MPTITCQGKTFEAHKGVDLLSQLLNGGCDVTYICMSGSCGTCRVKVTAGAEHLTGLSGMERAHRVQGEIRLSCQALVTGTGDITVG